MDLIGSIKTSMKKGSKSNRALQISDGPRRLQTSDVVRKSDYEDDLLQSFRRVLPRPEPPEERYYRGMLLPASDFILQTVARLRNELSSQQDEYSLQIGTMQSKHADTAKRLEKSLGNGEKALQNLKWKHDQETQKIAAKHGNEFSEMDRRRQKSITEGNERLQSVQRKPDQEMQSIAAKHKNELSEMHRLLQHSKDEGNQRLQDLQGEHEWQMQSIAAEHRNELSVLYGKHERQMNDTKTQHAEEIEKTKREVADMRNSLASAMDQAAREKWDMIEVHETEKMSLQDQYERDRDEQERERASYPGASARGSNRRA